MVRIFAVRRTFLRNYTRTKPLKINRKRRTFAFRASLTISMNTSNHFSIEASFCLFQRRHGEDSVYERFSAPDLAPQPRNGRKKIVFIDPGGPSYALVRTGFSAADRHGPVLRARPGRFLCRWPAWGRGGFAVTRTLHVRSVLITRESDYVPLRAGSITREPSKLHALHRYAGRTFAFCFQRG